MKSSSTTTSYPCRRCTSNLSSCWTQYIICVLSSSSLCHRGFRGLTSGLNIKLSPSLVAPHIQIVYRRPEAPPYLYHSRSPMAASTTSHSGTPHRIHDRRSDSSNDIDIAASSTHLASAFRLLDLRLLATSSSTHNQAFPDSEPDVYFRSRHPARISIPTPNSHSTPQTPTDRLSLESRISARRTTTKKHRYISSLHLRAPCASHPRISQNQPAFEPPQLQPTRARNNLAPTGYRPQSTVRGLRPRILTADVPPSDSSTTIIQWPRFRAPVHTLTLTSAPGTQRESPSPFPPPTPTPHHHA